LASSISINNNIDGFQNFKMHLQSNDPGRSAFDTVYVSWPVCAPNMKF